MITFLPREMRWSHSSDPGAASARSTVQNPTFSEASGAPTPGESQISWGAKLHMRGSLGRLPYECEQLCQV